MEPVLGIRWENKIKVCNPKGEGNTELGFKNHQKWWDPLRTPLAKKGNAHRCCVVTLL